MVLGEVDGYKTKEIEEQFLNAFGKPALADGALLNGIQFKQKETVCGTEALATKRMAGREEIAVDDAHQFHEIL